MIDESTSPMALEAEQAPDSIIDIDTEVERAAEEESHLAAPKTRTGGRHPDIRDGEVGPCTRCGWVWTPSARTLRTRPVPLRCSNCRSDYWMVEPVMGYARRPDDPEWTRRRDTIANRKRRRKIAKMESLAEEIGVKVVGTDALPIQHRKHAPKRRRKQMPDAPQAVDLTPRMPWQGVQSSPAPPRPRPIIPPPPGMEGGE